MAILNYSRKVSQVKNTESTAPFSYEEMVRCDSCEVLDYENSSYCNLAIYGGNSATRTVLP